MGTLPHVLIETNHRLASRFYAHAGSAVALPGALAVHSGYNSTAFNISSLTGPTPHLPTVLKTVTAHYDQLQTGSSLWLCEQYAAAPDRAAMFDYGYTFQLSAPGMLAEPFPAPRHALTQDLTIRCVENAQDALVFAHLVSIIFRVSFPLCQCIYGNPDVWRRPVYGFLAYRVEEPDACAMVTANAGVAGFYSVGTLPHFQGRGSGEKIMRHAATYSETHFGCSLSVLQSSPAGRKLYDRLGFREYTHFSIFNRSAKTKE